MYPKPRDAWKVKLDEMEPTTAMSMLVIENPDGAAPQLAISPSFIEATRLKVESVGLQPSIPDDYTTPPTLRAVPPMLRRQNASRFSWPPDSHQEWCYIGFSPQEFADQAVRLLEVSLTVQQVVEFFQTRADESRAYGAYYSRWREVMEEVSSTRYNNSVLR